MANDPSSRIRAFMELNASSVSKKKTNKQAAKRMDKAAKKPATVKGKDAGSFHDKLEAKLATLAKKHGVSIKLRKNVRKMPVVIIGKIKNKSYGEVVRLFKAIPNSSPAPQKLLENGASFTIFGKRKMTASEDRLSNGGPPLDDVVKRNAAIDDISARIKHIHKQLLAATTIEEAKKLGAEMKRCQDRMGKLRFPDDLVADESAENAEADGTGEDNSYDESEEEGYEDEGDDEPETTEEEDEANIQAIVDYIGTNNITREAVNGVFENAMKVYMDDLKTGELFDEVGAIYSTLGPDDAKNAFKALVNKETLTASVNRFKRGK